MILITGLVLWHGNRQPTAESGSVASSVSSTPPGVRKMQPERSMSVEPTDCDAANATPCLQAAINKAAMTAAMVHLPAGTYVLRSNLTLRTGVSLDGEDGTVLLPAADNRSDPVLLVGDKIRGVTISDIAFEGGGTDFANGHALISLKGTSGVLLDHVSVRHVRGKAIVFVGNPLGPSTSNGLINSVVQDVGNHWKASGKRADRDVAVLFWDSKGTATGNFATNNQFSDIGLDALQVTGQDGFLADQNVFELWNNQIATLKSDDYPAAIFTTRSRHVTISGNTIHQAVGNGIDAPGLTDSVIENNTITECGQSGIGIFQNYDGDNRDAGGITIRGNVIENNAIWPPGTWKAGISLGGGQPYDIHILGNTITDTRPTGKKTQDYGIDVVNGGGITTRPKGLAVDADNMLKGNHRAAKLGF